MNDELLKLKLSHFIPWVILGVSKVKRLDQWHHSWIVRSLKIQPPWPFLEKVTGVSSSSSSSQGDEPRHGGSVREQIVNLPALATRPCKVSAVKIMILWDGPVCRNIWKACKVRTVKKETLTLGKTDDPRKTYPIWEVLTSMTTTLMPPSTASLNASVVANL